MLAWLGCCNPLLYLSTAVFKYSQTYSELASSSPIHCCPLLQPAVLFSSGNLASTPPLHGRKAVQGSAGQWVWLPETFALGPGAGCRETAGSRAQQRLSEADKILRLPQWLRKQLLPS